MPKKEFYLEPNQLIYRASKVVIVGQKPEDHPYISFYVPGGGEIGILSGQELQRFAVNILKALGSKKLKP